MRQLCTLTLLACAAAQAETYSTYIADVNPYQVSALAADSNGNAYLTGNRVVSYDSSDRPITDVFVAKLDPSGNLTLIATFSGKGSDRANAIALDPSGNTYIAGSTTSPDFPLRNPLQTVASTIGQGIMTGTGFVLKLAPDGSLIYATYLGGTTSYSALFGVAQMPRGIRMSPAPRPLPIISARRACRPALWRPSAGFR